MEKSMAPDDRDRTFEKALARHLRPGVREDGARENATFGTTPNETHDALSETQDAAGALHPGAEILAAYHERLLAPEQMILWKGHIAGCERCQQVLAHLEVTDDIMVEDTQEEPQAEDVLKMPEAAFARTVSPSETKSATAAPRATAAGARWSRRIKILPGANWRWLAPAGAVAAGLLLWISFHEASAPSFQLVKNQQTAPSPAARSQSSLPFVADKETGSAGKAASTYATSPATEPRARADRDAAGGTAPSFSAGERAHASRESDALRRNESGLLDEKRSPALKADKPSIPHAAPSPPGPGTKKDREVNQPNVVGGVVAEEAELQKQKPAAISALSPAPTTTESKDQRDDRLEANTNQVKAENYAKTAEAKAVSGAAGRRAPQSSPPPANVQSALQETVPPAKEIGKLPVGQTAAERVASVGKLSAAVATIPAPGGTILWSAGQAGIIRRSADGGATWIVQTSGVVDDLLAGSASSDKVCWIVGRSGTILRTIDGGAHWQKIRAPVTGDFSAVFAVDAQQASVSLAQVSYQTKDGGHTWTKVLAE
jgi:Photosynthesis system II assembly factor YCF48